MPLGLVSYGNSDSDQSESEEDEMQKTAKGIADTVPIESGEISDEDEVIPSVLDEEDNVVGVDIPGLSSSTSLFDSLPSVSTSSVPLTSKADFVDKNEDLSTIPKAKIYSEKPDLKAVKPKKKGPIRIMAPSLTSSLDDDDDKPSRPIVRAPSAIKSGLFGLLPPPKNSLTTTSSKASSSSTSNPSSKPIMVPRSVSKKPLEKIKTVSKSGNDSDDEDVPFFTVDAAKIQEKSMQNPNLKMSVTVTANPEALHPRGIKPGSHPSHQYRYDEDQQPVKYSSVTAPYPPPRPEPQSSHHDDHLQPSQEALQRLAGAAGSKRRKIEEESLNQIIDVNFDDIKPDEREWLTKALTEDDADKPGPKNTIKGERRSKHQITWLAAEAKQNEQKLKKQWAESASNKRAAGNKYGF